MSVRVYVLWEHPIFYDTARVILQHPKVEWSGGSSDMEQAKKAIFAHQPDIILVEQDQRFNPKDIIQLLQNKFVEVRVISLSLNDNQVQIISHQQKTIVHEHDLLRLVLAND